MTDPNPQRRDPRYRWLFAGIGLVLAGLLTPLVYVLVSSPPDDAPAPTPSTDARVRADEAATVVWPDPGGPLRHASPDEAARGFVDDFIGFADPLFGPFHQGDTRSGEFEVRAGPEGPVTVVLVRQMSDQHWYVLGAAASGIELDVPTAGATIASPLRMAGRARAFEGRLRVAVYARGRPAPLGEAFVDAGAVDAFEAFAGEVAWDGAGAGAGVVVVTAPGGEDGGVWEAVAVPVRLGGEG